MRFRTILIIGLGLVVAGCGEEQTSTEPMAEAATPAVETLPDDEESPIVEQPEPEPVKPAAKRRGRAKAVQPEPEPESNDEAAAQPPKSRRRRRAV